jgi:hypothetical protein
MKPNKVLLPVDFIIKYFFIFFFSKLVRLMKLSVLGLYKTDGNVINEWGAVGGIRTGRRF